MTDTKKRKPKRTMIEQLRDRLNEISNDIAKHEAKIDALKEERRSLTDAVGESA